MKLQQIAITAAVLLLFATIGTLLVALTYEGTRAQIAANEREALLHKLNVLVPPERYEFQMLLGVRNWLRDQLIASGHRVRIYVPFGEDWYGYSTRRLRENPEIAGHVFKAMLGFK